jgi:hypothetical protein
MGKVRPVSRLHGQSLPPELRIPVRSTFISRFLAFPLATSSDSFPECPTSCGKQFSFRERLHVLGDSDLTTPPETLYRGAA